MVFHWSFSDSKSPQVSRTLLSIVAVLSNAVIWIVSTCPPTSMSFRPFNNPVVIVAKTQITIRAKSVNYCTFHVIIISRLFGKWLLNTLAEKI